MLDELIAICHGFNRRFPDGCNPYQMMTRLLEESGELAKEINHFEHSGVKIEKYGLPDKEKLAKEIMQTINCALQVAIYYDVVSEMKSEIDASYRRMIGEGWITE